MGVQARHLVLAAVEGGEEVLSLKEASGSCTYAISLHGTSLWSGEHWSGCLAWRHWHISLLLQGRKI